MQFDGYGRRGRMPLPQFIPMVTAETLLANIREPLPVWKIIFLNKGFLDSDTHILDNMNKIANIPGYIVQGRYDMICPQSAWAISKLWPKADLDGAQCRSCHVRAWDKL